MPKSILPLALLILSIVSHPAAGFTVDGNDIVDGTGQRIQLRGVNWFGFETQNYVVHGLWTRNWQEMIAQMKTLGFNAVRLPFCPDTLHGMTPNSIDYNRNGDLAGLDSLQVMDEVIAEFDRQGIYVLLDHHRPDCAAISELWYTADYAEADWIDDLVFAAQRYRHHSYLLGIDLKNEPHGSATWGINDSASDWNSAAERAAESVLQAAPELLVFVEGVQENPQCSGTVNHWWGGNLEPFNCFPLNIPANKLVLSPHVYGPDVYQQSYFSAADFPDNMPAIWDAHFGQFHDMGYAVVIGEFGGRYGHGGADSDRVWQDALVDYLSAKGMTSAFYWSWNPNSGDTGGILQDDWNTVWQDKVDLLQRLWGQDSGNPPLLAACQDGVDNDGDGLTDYPADPDCVSVDDNDESAPLPSAACADGVDNDGDGLIDFPDDPGCDSTQDTDEYHAAQGDVTVDTAINSDWGTGYCLNATVTNHGSTTVDWSVSLVVEGSINQIWNAIYQVSGGETVFDGVEWNNLLASGAQTAFGFCADRDSVPQATACADGIDNDGDGLTDFPADPGCDSADDGDETNLPPSGQQLETKVTTTNDWQSGYCADVTVTNPTSTAIDWQVTFAVEGVVYNLWNANYHQDGNTVTADGLSWNNQVPADDSVRFGFCANR